MTFFAGVITGFVLAFVLSAITTACLFAFALLSPEEES